LPAKQTATGPPMTDPLRCKGKTGVSAHGTKKSPGTETSMNMAEDGEHFDEICTHAERPAVAAWSQNRRRYSVICPAPFAPSHTLRVFPTAQGKRQAPHRSPKPDAGPPTLAAHGLTLLPPQSQRGPPCTIVWLLH